MKIVVTGPGAVGCLFASYFAEAGKDVLLLDKFPERAEKINEQGIQMEGISGEKHFDVKATANPADIGNADLVLICVKSPDTEEAAKLANKLVKNDTVVMTLQNGLGNVESIAEVVGEKHVVGGTTAQGATLLGEGHIRHAGNGETVIGELVASDSNRLEKIKYLFEECGIPTNLTDDLNGLLWSKLIINVGINALTALARLRNGKLIEYEGTRTVLRDAVEEAVEVASKSGINLLFDDPVAKVESVCEATAVNISSMFQDVLRGNRTEIDYINGAIVRRASKLGIPVPVNETLTRLVRTIQEGYSEQVNSL